MRRKHSLSFASIVPAEPNIMDKICGECKLTVNDLEPIRCGLCESCYHINQQCCGLNSRLCKELFAQGKIIFICPTCRELLNGRSLCAYLADQKSNHPSSQQNLTALPAQVQKLTEIVDGLSKKIDTLSSTTVNDGPILGTPIMPTTPIWPRVNNKRRRTEREPIEMPSDRGANTIDFSDLSVPSIVPAIAQNRFWLYVSGLNPLLTDSDIQKIVSRCLNTTEPVVALRLVRKGVDSSNFSYVSYKIGLDPKLKTAALDPASWPTGMLFREFVNLPKN